MRARSEDNRSYYFEIITNPFVGGNTFPNICMSMDAFEVVEYSGMRLMVRKTYFFPTGWTPGTIT